MAKTGRAILVAASISLVGCTGDSSPPSMAIATVVPTSSLQSTPNAPPATIAPTASASASTAPVDVRGTHITITPPEGFVPSTAFAGFEHACGASIVVSELPTSYSGLVNELSDANLTSKGFADVTRHDETVDGRPGVFITARQKVGSLSYLKILVLTGTDALTAFLTGNFPLADCRVEVGEQMRDAELGMTLDPDRDVDAEAALSFTIKPLYPLIFASALNNAATYNTSGITPSADPNEPTLIIAPSFGYPAGTDLEAFAIAHLKGMSSIQDVVIEKKALDTIAGRPASVIAGTARSSTRGVAIFVYQVLIGGDGDFVVMLGTSGIDRRVEAQALFAVTSGTYAPKP